MNWELFTLDGFRQPDIWVSNNLLSLGEKNDFSTSLRPRYSFISSCLKPTYINELTFQWAEKTTNIIHLMSDSEGNS